MAIRESRGSRSIPTCSRLLQANEGAIGYDSASYRYGREQSVDIEYRFPCVKEGTSPVLESQTPVPHSPLHVTIADFAYRRCP
jgi:hypothetical protein